MELPRATQNQLEPARTCQNQPEPPYCVWNQPEPDILSLQRVCVKLTNVRVASVHGPKFHVFQCVDAAESVWFIYETKLDQCFIFMETCWEGSCGDIMITHF